MTEVTSATRRPPSATKAQAVAQNLATRKARNTMGKRQNAAVIGTVDSPGTLESSCY
jgi:hypothetical protein